jgi:hypothetical protein
MQKTVLISLPIEDLQSVIIDCVNTCLSYNKQTPVQNEQPINTKELINFLDITEPTLIRWRKKGKIPFLKIGSRILYQKGAVLAALENKKGLKNG